MNPGLSVWLDLMRLLAAVAVVAQHMNERSIAGKVLWQAGKFGVVAVVVFFVLSGFVIGYVVSSREQTVRAYVVARAARIYSVAILAVPVTLIADAIGIRANDIFYKGQSYFNADTGPLDVVLSWSFLNEVWRTHTFIGTDQPYWSLGFEVWYYAIFGIFHFVKRIRPVTAVWR